MEADFAGWATRAGLTCSDGRVIYPDAFKHQDSMQVPLVWQHGHTDPENVLGHAILENREEGVYCYGFFNGSEKAKHAAQAVDHKDIKHLSIWANNLVERGGKVFHGVIREVSLVLSGANPGALIESITIRHSDGESITLDDEAIIYTGLEIEHSTSKDDVETEKKEEVQETGQVVEHDDLVVDDNTTIQDVYDSLTDVQKNVVNFMIGQAIQDVEAETQPQMQQDSMSHTDTNANENKEGTTEMTHNVFEQDKKKSVVDHSSEIALVHSNMDTIVGDATKRFGGSLRESLKEFALQHGIDNLDVLFPEAQNISTQPQFLARRTEWVQRVLGGARKTPFSRIKTRVADLTMDEARAKGYVKGALKKEEFFNILQRTTTPQTVYKKQKLDRDDVVDITDFDVVVWLKAEMRLMLEEELARAILIGDGRDPSDADKINASNIRPIATDHELFVTTLTVNLGDASSSYLEVVDSLIVNRGAYRGTGLPTMFCSESTLAQFMILRETNTNARMFKTVADLAAELRVADVVPVMALEDEPDIVCILVNMADYVVGADQGGQVSLFDDFDIDYNQYKYLIETRVSGALDTIKSAIVVRKSGSSATPVTPAAPTFDTDTGEVTIHDTSNVTYKNAVTDATMTNSGGPYSVDPGDEITIVATANTGYYLPTTAGTSWRFVNRNSA